MKRLLALALGLLLACIPLAGCGEEKTGQKLVDQFTESVFYDPDEGELRFTVPKDTPADGVWTILCSGRLRMGDDFMSWHGFQDVTDWEPGKTYTEALAPDAVDSLTIDATLTTSESGQYGVTIELLSDGSMMAVNRVEQ